MMKKIWIYMISLMMVVTMIPIQSYAANDQSDNYSEDNGQEYVEIVTDDLDENRNNDNLLGDSEDGGDPSGSENPIVDPVDPIDPGDTDPSHEHVAGDWVVQPASFTKDGIRTKSCTVCGEVMEEETIDKVSSVTLNQKGYTYTGSQIAPTVTVSDTQGKALTLDEDYTLQFYNNIEVGKATVKVILMGDYTGTKTVDFPIFNNELYRTNLLVGTTKDVSIDTEVTDVLGTNISYSIANPYIATVDSEGVVTGNGTGTTTLTATVGGCVFKSTVNVFETKQTQVVADGNHLYSEETQYHFIYDGKSTYKIEITGANAPVDIYVYSASYYDEETDEYIRGKQIIHKYISESKKASYVIDSSKLVVGTAYRLFAVCWDYVSDYWYGDSDGTYRVIKVPLSERIALNESTCHLIMTDTKKLSYFSDKNTHSIIKWSTSDSSIATVSSNGTVTAKKPGTCMITATLHNGFTDQCKVVVKQYPKITFTTKKVTITGIASKKLKLVKQDAICDKITWTSSNPNIATINSYGKVTSKKGGTVTITASTPDAEGSCTVVVKPVIKKKTVNIYYKKSGTNKLVAAPGKVYWSSSNKKIATVTSKGKITGKKPGSCTITAKCKGEKYTCKVTVKPIKLSKTSAKIARGNKLKLTVKGGNGKIVWKTSNKKVAKVTSKGVIKAINPGKCTITMKRNGYTKKCKVRVYRRSPNFGACLDDYNTRGNYFVVKFRNKGPKTLKITAGIKVEDCDYKAFDRSVRLKKTVTLKAGQAKYVRFYVKDKTTWYDYMDFTLYFKFKYDGATYKGWTDLEDSCYKKGTHWYTTYKSRDWYEMNV